MREYWCFSYCSEDMTVCYDAFKYHNHYFRVYMDGHITKADDRDKSFA